MVLGTACILCRLRSDMRKTKAQRREVLQTDLTQVPAGQKMNVEGVIVNQGTDSLTMRGTGGGLYKVLVAGAEIREKKSNPFRGAKELFESGPPAGSVYRSQGIRRRFGIDCRP